MREHYYYIVPCVISRTYSLRQKKKIKPSGFVFLGRMKYVIMVLAFFSIGNELTFLVLLLCNNNVTYLWWSLFRVCIFKHAWLKWCYFAFANNCTFSVVCL